MKNLIITFILGIIAILITTFLACLIIDVFQNSIFGGIIITIVALVLFAIYMIFIFDICNDEHDGD